MYINRKYLKDKILEVSQEKNIIDATKKIQHMYGIQYYILYNFTRKSVPKEETLLKIIKYLSLDTHKLFVID